MSIRDVKEWMNKNEKTVVDIAAALKLHPQTIMNFLNGKRVQRSTKALIEALTTNDSKGYLNPQKTGVG